ncbi:MAG TPA: hypothetical protein EYN66_04320 [Myxococcales bacterium]|nr:hypothetical protein [Myxococcales bacterium]
MTEKPFIDLEYAVKAEQALLTRYGRFLKEGEVFKVTGTSEDDAWGLKVVFENTDRSLHLPMDVVLVARENPGLTRDDARAALVDFVDYFFDRYFQGAREITLPIDWAEFPFGDHKVRARGWEQNLKLENAADRLLAGESIDDLKL